MSQPLKNIQKCPREILSLVFNYIASEQIFTLRITSKQFNEAIECLLQSYWGNLKKEPPVGVVDIKHCIEKFEKKFPNETFFFLFKQLEKEFVVFGTTLPVGRLAFTTDAILLLQKEAQISHYRSLNLIWKRIQRTQQNFPVLTTATKIKDWIHDPKNSDQLNRITQISFLCAYYNKSIVRITPHEISKLTQLRVLHFQSRRMLTCFTDTMGNLNLLENLGLDNCQLRSLSDAIGNLANLQILRLKNNKLSQLPSTFGNLKSLRCLFLNENNLKKLPQEFDKMKMLRVLDLTKNQFTIVPDVIFNLEELSGLSFSQNSLSSLPNEFEKLTNLNKLDLGSNKFSEVPSIIEKLTNLVEISLAFNQISYLSNAIGKLTQLQKLHLCNNKINLITKEIRRLTQLKHLNLEQNKLMRLPDEIGGLKNLKELKIKNNPFQNITDIILRSEYAVNAIMFFKRASIKSGEI